MNNSNLELVETLKNASEGLLYMSESDYPFEVFLWEGKGEHLTTEELLQQTNHPSDTPVEVEDFDYFFEYPTEEQDWHDETQKETVRKYQNLVQIMKTNLTDISVYRIGEVQIDVYIMGKTQSGNLAGLCTKVVES